VCEEHLRGALSHASVRAISQSYGGSS
jgi:hypothetical protein